MQRHASVDGSPNFTSNSSRQRKIGQHWRHVHLRGWQRAQPRGSVQQIPHLRRWPVDCTRQVTTDATSHAKQPTPGTSRGFLPGGGIHCLWLTWELPTETIEFTGSSSWFDLLRDRGLRNKDRQHVQERRFVNLSKPVKLWNWWQWAHQLQRKVCLNREEYTVNVLPSRQPGITHQWPSDIIGLRNRPSRPRKAARSHFGARSGW